MSMKFRNVLAVALVAAALARRRWRLAAGAMDKAAGRSCATRSEQQSEQKPDTKPSQQPSAPRPALMRAARRPFRWRGSATAQQRMRAARTMRSGVGNRGGEPIAPQPGPTAPQRGGRDRGTSRGLQRELAG